ncbi:hypothetical protein AcV5_001102 [Taiwanofungus camphoratus]|nr:hypothetical protein AcV5_001102 [Antrodia cinnamomea]
MHFAPSSPQNALPTPPHSPDALEPTQPAVILLDSLTAFYQQERYWIHHTRAALELALAKGIDAPALSYPSASPSPSSSVTSIGSPDSTASDDVAVAAVPVAHVKPDPDAHDADADADADAEATRRATRWARRKNMMKLKLDGIAPHTRQRRRPHRAPPSEPGARLLEMFSALVDARMESCQRVSRLVRDTQRADLEDLCIC